MTTTTTETKTDHNIIQQDQDTTTKILDETSASSPAFENEITATITESTTSTSTTTNMTVTTADTTTTTTTTDNNDVFPPSTSTIRSTSESPPPPATPPPPPAATATTTTTSTAPPKRPRTAYFLFMTDKRQTVQEEHPGQSVGNISKILGQMWKDLDPKEKENYQQRATLEKEKYRLDWDLYQRQQQQQKQQSTATASEELTAAAVEDSSFSSLHHDPAKNENHVMLTLPMARIRKICRLDPQVKGISKEAVLLVTRTAELFTYKLGQETFRMAEIQKRKKLLTQDVVDVTQLKETFYFLKDDLLDLFKEQQQQQQHHQQQQQHQQKQQQDNATTHSAPDPKRPMSTKAAMAIANTKPLTSFFHKK